MMETRKEKRDLYKINRKIFVGNISYRVRSKRLGEFFTKFGPVEHSYIVKDHLRKWSRGIGFVTFENEEGMKKALQATDRDLTFDSREMRVKPAELSSRTTYWQSSDDDDDEDDTTADATTTDTAVSNRVDHSTMDTSCDDVDDDSTGKDNMGMEGTHIDHLFDEILVQIFTLLSVKERMAIERVCWRWKHLVQKSWLSLRHLHVQNMFKGFNGLTDKILNAILLRCGQYLEKIDLSASPRILSDFAMDIIGKYCPQLQELDLTGVRVTDISIWNLTSKCKQLKHVRMRRCCHITEKGVNHLCSGSKNLQYLDISELHQLKGQHCFDHVGDSLRSVVLSDCTQLSDKAVDTLCERCRNLEEINMARSAVLTSHAIQVIAKSLDSLRVLNIESTRAATNALQSLSQLHNLEDLNVAFAHHFNDQTLEAVVKGCKKLRCINLSGCHLSDAGVSCLANLPALTSVNVSYMYSEVTQDSIQQIAAVGRLRQFVARTSKCATDEAIISLATFCPDLELCDLSGCFQVSNSIFDGFRQACKGDAEKTVDLYLGGTCVDWIADDVDWMSGFSHLNVSMNNLSARELQPEQDLILPDAIHSDDEENEEDEQYAPHPPISDFQQDYVDDQYDWDEDEDQDFFLDNDDPLAAERWDMS